MSPDAHKPAPRSTNIFIEAWDHVKYPIVAEIPGVSPATDIAVVAIVTATDAKIDFIIDVEHALRVSVHELVHHTSWIDGFYRAFESRSGVNVKRNVKGWTTAILREAMHPYRARFQTKPRCMIGVFDQRNHEVFWSAFDEQVRPDEFLDVGSSRLLDAAADCVRRTPFWRPRQELGFTRLMFDIDALRRRNVFVRAFRDDLDQDEIDVIAKHSPKLYDVPTGKWGFSYGGRPFQKWTSEYRSDT